MIVLNGKRFAKDNEEFTSSLFKAGGTCMGYYKRLHNKVKLFDMQYELIGVITNNKVLAKATKLDNGKYWYSYAMPDIIGEYDSYSTMVEDISKALV